jgi:hypothetical protein
MPMPRARETRPMHGVPIVHASRVPGILSLALALIAFGLIFANVAAASQTDSQFSAVDDFIEAEMRTLTSPVWRWALSMATRSCACADSESPTQTVER